MPRVHCPMPLSAGASLELPAGAARHVQVLRMQPGEAVTLFNGEGGEYAATIERMGRSNVAVRVDSHDPVEREAVRAVHLAAVMPANDRMDWLVEKATELGAASLQPLVAQHSVLRPTGERAAKKQAHWQAIAVAACEQCGRNRVPPVHAPRSLEEWLPGALAGGAAGLLLSLREPMAADAAAAADGPVVVLSGPEGGLSAQEEDAALARGFRPLRLGPRVLRAETAPLAVLARLAF